MAARISVNDHEPWLAFVSHNHRDVERRSYNKVVISAVTIIVGAILASLSITYIGLGLFLFTTSDTLIDNQTARSLKFMYIRAGNSELNKFNELLKLACGQYVIDNVKLTTNEMVNAHRAYFDYQKKYTPLFLTYLKCRKIKPHEYFWKSFTDALEKANGMYSINLGGTMPEKQVLQILGN